MKKLFLMLLCAVVCALGQINRTTATAIQAGDLYTISDAGANDTYTGCPTIPVTAYATKSLYVFKPNTVNTGAATLNVCSLGAKSIKTSAGNDPADGELAAGKYYLLAYDGTNLQIVGGGAPTAAALDVILAPGADGCVTPTVNGSALEMVFSKPCLETLAFTWTGLHIAAQSSTQAITAVGNPILANANNVAVDPDGTYTLTSTPTIANGTAGQQLTICNVDTALTLTLQDEANLAGSNIRNGGSNVSIAPRLCRSATYTNGDWSFASAGASLSGQTFTWTDDSETWMSASLTPAGVASGSLLFTYAPSPNEVGTFAFGGGDIANRWGVLTFDYHATDDKFIFKVVKIPTNFVSLDFKLETLGSAAASGNIVWGTAYRCYSATAVSIGNDATAFGNAATATVAYTNLASSRVTGTISNVITVAGCPAGSLAQIKFSRKSAAGGTTFTGVASVVSITPVWNFTRTL